MKTPWKPIKPPSKKHDRLFTLMVFIIVVFSGLVVGLYWAQQAYR